MRGKRPAASSRTSALLLVLAACGSKSEAPKSPPIGNVLAAVLTAADATTAPWRCAATDTPPLVDAELTVGEHTWKASGSALTRMGGAGAVVIGVIADAGGADSRTIAALGRLRAAFDAAKPTLVLTLGGMGATATELEGTLGTLCDRAPWPVVALPGDLEHESAQNGAIANLRKRGNVIVDGRQVRTIALPGATIGTVPGAGAAERLAAPTDGCAWTPADISAVFTSISAASGIRIVAMAEAPRRSVDGEAAGELALVPSTTQPIELVLHAPVQPTATSPTNGGRDGDGVLLSPGTSDAASRLPRTHRPTAGLLTIRGTSWAWRPLVDAN